MLMGLIGIKAHTIFTKELKFCIKAANNTKRRIYERKYEKPRLGLGGLWLERKETRQ
jgi:hypothetical protein